MLFAHRTFWLPKDVQEPNGYEDAFEVDEIRGKAAVCDGVSSSLFSGRWASILAKAAVFETPRTNDPAALEEWLRRQREAWAATVDESALAWHQKPKVLDGAGSTLLWVEITGTDGPESVARPRQLRCYSIGDCCLFHIRGSQVLQTFPIQDSARFEDHPNVIRSVFKRSDATRFEAMETQCNPGDLLLLCSDAVAWWTMRQIEAGVSVDWEAYWQLTNADWQQWMMELRQANQIRYDDSTVVLLRIGGAAGKSSSESSHTEGKLLDQAESTVRDALKSLKGGLRRSLKGLSESKWLQDDRPK
jgi:hypothetical protein